MRQPSGGTARAFELLDFVMRFFGSVLVEASRTAGVREVEARCTSERRSMSRFEARRFPPKGVTRAPDEHYMY